MLWGFVLSKILSLPLKRGCRMSAPVDETSLPIGELFSRACSFLKQQRDTAGEAVWRDAVEELLDRLLVERPELAVYSRGVRDVWE